MAAWRVRTASAAAAALLLAGAPRSTAFGPGEGTKSKGCGLQWKQSKLGESTDLGISVAEPSLGGNHTRGTQALATRRRHARRRPVDRSSACTRAGDRRGPG